MTREKYQIARKTYPIYSEYYIVANMNHMNEPGEEFVSVLYEEASKEHMAYYTGYSKTLSGYPSMSINKDMLIDIGVKEENIYDVYIPYGQEIPSEEGKIYKYYTPTYEYTDIAPIVSTTNHSGMQLPYFIDEDFAYEQYQNDEISNSYVYPASTYFMYMTILHVLTLINIILEIVVVIFFMITCIYLYTVSFITRKRSEFIVQVTNGTSKLIIMKELIINYSIVILTSLFINYLLFSSLAIVLIIVGMILITVLFSYYIVNKKINEIVGEL